MLWRSPFTGRSQLLGVPMAWRRRQAMAKWRLGPIKWRWTWGPGVGAPRHFNGPQRHLAMAWRRRQAMGTPSNWERPVNGNAITLDIRKRRGGVGWGGRNWRTHEFSNKHGSFRIHGRNSRIHEFFNTHGSLRIHGRNWRIHEFTF